MSSVNSFRIAYENWYTDERFGETLELLTEYRSAVDEVVLFTSSIHTPRKPEEITVLCGIMKKRLTDMRKSGINAVGIDLLCTLGHHNEDLDNCFSGNYKRMTNIDGEVCEGSFCMNDERYVNDYVIPTIKALAGTGCDFLWIDDDVRYGHMPIGNGCFCDCCMTIFNNAYGYDYTRTTLKEALNLYDIPLREQWLRKQSDSITGLLGKIRNAVNEVHEGLTVGFMTGERYTEGYDFGSFADVLSGHGRYNLKWRPGGGQYADEIPTGFQEKAAQIGRQISLLPGYVKDIQSEVENFPYQIMKKSPSATAIEAAQYICAGCTGTAFNIFPGESGESISISEGHMKAIREMTPFYRKLSGTLRTSPSVGIHTGWLPHSQKACRNFINGYGGEFADFSTELFSLGLPQAYDFDKAAVYLLKGDAPYAMDKCRISEMLSKGAYIDAEALDALWKLGYGEYTGFRPGRKIPVDAIEEYLPHPLNDGFEGGKRNCRQAFNKGISYEILPFADAEALTMLADYNGNMLAGCSMGVYVNSLGGKICVSGYYPYTWISDTYKSCQLKRIFEYLSDNTMPGYVESSLRSCFSSRLISNGQYVWCVQNLNMEKMTNIKIRLMTFADKVTLVDMSNTEIILNAKTDSEKMKYIVAPELKPFNIYLIR